MNPNLCSLLKECSVAVEDELACNFTTFYPNKVDWYVPSENLEALWLGYCDLVAEKAEGLCLGEKVGNTFPVVHDIELRFKIGDDGDEEIYDTHFVHNMVMIMQSLIGKHYNLLEENRDTEYVCCVSETSAWRRGDIVYHRLRFQFPYCRADATSQRRLRLSLVDVLGDKNAGGSLLREPLGSWKDRILAVPGPKNDMCLQGSSTSADMPPYAFSGNCYMLIPEGQDVADFEENIENTFRYDNHKHITDGSVTEDSLSHLHIEHMVPFLMSVHYCNVVTKPKLTTNDSRPNIQLKQGRPFGFNGAMILDDETDMELCLIFLPMIKPSKYITESIWLDVGRALFNACRGDDTGCDPWLRVTMNARNKGYIQYIDNKKDQGSIEEIVLDKYRSFTDDQRITYKTLARYANEDSPDVYSQWYDKRCDDVMEIALCGTDYSVARAFYWTNWLDFICSDPKSREFYHFDGKRWKKTAKGIRLRKVFVGSFYRRYETIRLRLVNETYKSRDDNMRRELEVVINKIVKIMQRIQSNRLENSVIESSIKLFYKDDFVSMLDTNPDVMGISNGVLEASREAIIHRQCKPEDYISKFTTVAYRKDLHWKSPKVVEFMTWLDQIFMDEENKDYFLKWLASLLKGRNSHKLLLSWWGLKNNAKSTLRKAIDIMLGPYAITLNFEAISQTPNATGPSPHLARIGGVRVIFVDEPDSDIKMKASVVKRITGNDSFFGRFCNQDGGEIQNLAKIAVISNLTPPVDMDDAVVIRLKILQFVGTWTKDAPEDINEQYMIGEFKLDPFFEDTLVSMAPAMLWVACMYYPHYIKYKMDDTKSIKRVTSNYWRENDPLGTFIADQTVKGTRDDMLSTTELYVNYKRWYAVQYPTGKVLDKPKFVKAMSARWQEPNGAMWSGVKWAYED